MIDAQTGSYTIDTLVKSQDEVTLYSEDVVGYKHICSENATCTDQTVAPQSDTLT